MVLLRVDFWSHRVRIILSEESRFFDILGIALTFGWIVFPESSFNSRFSSCKSEKMYLTKIIIEQSCTIMTIVMQRSTGNSCLFDTLLLYYT